ncbi:hypothetical protein HDU93_002903 [Gonapodya sp. JEL0774]|nr:hypothetical protein HDU93_002903 [Gonapodya sp. JEL0774]
MGCWPLQKVDIVSQPFVTLSGPGTVVNKSYSHHELSPTLVMETLPVEILHKILRLLPPRVFYTVIPTLSHCLRDASRHAIPGCPHHQLAITCTLKVDPESSSLVERSDSYPFTPMFEASRTAGRDGKAVWTSTRIDVYLVLDDILNYWAGNIFEELSRDRRQVVRRLSYKAHRLIEYGVDIQFLFQHVNLSMWYSPEKRFVWDGPRVTKLMGELTAFVKEHKVHAMTFRRVSTCIAIEKWCSGIVLGSVTHLQTVNIRLEEMGASVPGRSNLASALQILLAIFPNVSTLAIEIGAFGANSVDQLIQHIPAAHRRKITSLEDKRGILLDLDESGKSANILHLARVFPRLQQISSVKLSDRLCISASPDPTTSVSQEAIQFNYLESVTLHVGTTPSSNLVKLGLESFNASVLLDGVLNHAPLLKEVNLNFDIVGFETDQPDEANAPMLAVLDRILATAATRPSFVIREVIENIPPVPPRYYTHTHVFGTRRDALQKCRLRTTRMFLKDLEKLAKERAVKLRWYRST